MDCFSLECLILMQKNNKTNKNCFVLARPVVKEVMLSSKLMV